MRTQRKASTIPGVLCFSMSIIATNVPVAEQYTGEMMKWLFIVEDREKPAQPQQAPTNESDRDMEPPFSEDEKFAIAVKYIFEREGEEYVSPTYGDNGELIDPPTKLGITLPTALTYGVVDKQASYEEQIEQLKEITKEDASKVYRDKYYEGICSGYHLLVAIACLDTSVISGQGEAKERLENTSHEKDPYERAMAIANRQLWFYQNKTSAEQRNLFLPGWQNRHEALTNRIDYLNKTYFIGEDRK